MDRLLQRSGPGRQVRHWQAAEGWLKGCAAGWRNFGKAAEKIPGAGWWEAKLTQLTLS